MCNRFYLNVGVRSRLVLTLIDQGELWGFISCWHGSPRRVSYADRLAYQNLAQVASLSLVEKEKAGRYRRTLDAKRRMDAIAQGLSPEEPAHAQVESIPAALLASLDIDGAALCLGHRIVRAGNTPGIEAIQAMLPWLDQQAAFYQTDRWPTDGETALGSAVTGLLSARLMEPGQYLLAFRPEWVHEVKWAGDPRKPVEQIPGAAPGEFRLTARGSFEEWKQVVKGHSRPWEDTECEALKDLQTAIRLWQQAQKVRVLMLQLEDSNEELKNFAYTVSHDLQEPLRGISNFGQFLNESIGGTLATQERNWLNGIRKLSLRMSQQIEALLHFSRASQQALDLRPINLGQLLTQVLDNLAGRISETGAEIVLPRALPTFRGDPERIRVVLENLIANAMKYNDQPRPRVEIGLVDGPVLTLFVQDNGIGIAENHREAVFDVFRRLHGREEYGGGTGAGLAIARKHVERHGGRLWVESAPGGGSRFLFTLETDPALETIRQATS
jgi:light-regulated signal transduction histidine kinase (bacteriophytochrome)